MDNQYNNLSPKNRRICSTSNAFLLIDSVFALLIASLAFASIIYLQREIVSEINKQDITLYREANQNLAQNIKHNYFSTRNIQTKNNYTYTFKVFVGKAFVTYNNIKQDYIVLHKLELIP